MIGAVIGLFGTAGLAIASVAKEEFMAGRVAANEAVTAEARRDAAEANRAAAEANRAAERDRLRVLELERDLEKRTAPRHMTGDLQSALIEAVSPWRGDVNNPARPIDAAVFSTSGVFESKSFAEQIAQTLEVGGWRINRNGATSPGFTYSLAGVGVMFGGNSPKQAAQAEALVGAFNAHGVLALFMPPPSFDITAISVYVGDHP